MNTLGDITGLLSNFNVLDDSKQPLFIKDNKGTYCYCNDSFAQSLGISKNRILGATAHQLFPTSHAKVYTASDRELFAGALKKQKYDGPIALVESGRSTATFKKDLICSSDGIPIGFLGTFELASPADAALALSSSKAKLTEKENDILSYLVKGFSQKKIAYVMAISPHTVASHMKAIYAKLNVHSKTEAVYKALIQIQIANA